MNAVRRSLLVLTEYPGSTRAIGLFRLFWALILWARWADELLPFKRIGYEYWLMAALFFVSTTGMVIGYKSRFSSLVAGCVTLYMVFVAGHMDGVDSWTHHHTTFLAVCTFLLALTPCGDSFSLDRWLEVRRAEQQNEAWPQEVGNLWATRLIALQLAAIYFWGAINKCRDAFLDGDRLEQPIMYLYFGSDSPGEWLHWICVAAAWGTVLLEFALAFGLWFRRFRPPLLVMGLILHFMIYYLLPVTVFTVASIAVYLVFLDPKTVHAFVDRLVGVQP